MTDPKSEQDKLLARLTAPMPERAQRELAACAATDRLEVALEAARIAVDLTLGAPAALGLDATAEEMQRRWLVVNQLLRDSFDTVEIRGHETIGTVRSLFRLDVVVPDRH